MMSSRLFAAMVLVALLAGVVSAEQLGLSDSNVSKLFAKFTQSFKRAYSTSGLVKRLAIFKANIQRINTLNARPKRTWEAGITEGADQTPEEFAKNLGLRVPKGYTKPVDPFDAAAFAETEAEAEAEANDKTWWDYGGRARAVKSAAKKVASINKALTKKGGALPAPAFDDWQTKSLLAPIRHQRGCGSCWAHASLTPVESLIAQQKQTTPAHLSVMALTHCSTVDLGCTGGWPANTFGWLRANPGALMSEEQYPYVPKNGNCTMAGKTPVGAKVTGSAYAGNGFHNLKVALRSAPVTMAVDASRLQLYKSGVMGTGETDCTLFTPTHAVVAIGYGSEPSTLAKHLTGSDSIEYVIVRNSWGAQWGEKGNFKLFADSLNDQIACLGGDNNYFPYVTA